MAVRRSVRLFIASMLAVAGGLIAGWPWRSVIATPQFTTLLIVSAVVSAGLPFLVRTVLRRGLLISLPLSLLAMVMVIVFGALGGLSSFGEFWRGLSDGLPHLMAVPLPVGSPDWIAVFPLVTVWSMSAIGGEFLSADPASSLPVIPWIVGLGASLSFSARSGGATLLVGVALVLVIGALLTLRTGTTNLAMDEDRGRFARLQDSLAGIETLVVICVAAALVVMVLPESGPTRSLSAVPPKVALSGENPTLLAAQLRYGQGAQDPIATFAPACASTSCFIPYAVVSKYGGTGWEFDPATDQFSPTNGGNAVQAVHQSSPRATGHLSVTVKSSRLAPYLLFGGLSNALTGIDANVDQSGMIAPDHDYQTPLTYQETFSMPLVAATTTAADMEFPVIPATVPVTFEGVTYHLSWLDSFAVKTGCIAPKEIAAAPNGKISMSQLACFLRYLNSEGRVAPGHRDSTTKQVEQFDLYGQSQGDLQATVAGPHYVGTPEQFSTVLALFLREHGVPARVVSGFKVPHAATSVAASDAYTWVEADESAFPGGGATWTPLDPTGTKLGNQPPPPAGSGTPPPKTSGGGKTKSGQVITVAVSKDASGTPQALVALLTIAIAVIGLALAAPVVAVALRRRRRKRRRRSGDARHKVIGAWLETIDHFAEVAGKGLASSTAEEILNVGVESLSPAGLAALVTLQTSASTALYDLDGAVGPEVADQVWSASDIVGEDLRSSMSWRDRLRNRFRYRQLF